MCTMSSEKTHVCVSLRIGKVDRVIGVVMINYMEYMEIVF